MKVEIATIFLLGSSFFLICYKRSRVLISDVQPTVTVDWNKRFSFVPNDIRNCNELLFEKEEPPKSFVDDYKR